MTFGKTDAAGQFISPDMVREVNLGRLSMIEMKLQEQGLPIDDYPLTLKCINCGLEATGTRGDPDFDRTVNMLKGEWRCRKDAGGCGSMREVVMPEVQA